MTGRSVRFHCDQPAELADIITNRPELADVFPIAAHLAESARWTA